MNINWDNLRVFLAVARSESALEAAATLEMDHSTVTRRLKLLEKDIGSQLFDRSPQGHVLTAIGYRLLQSVEKIEYTLAVIDSEVGGDNQLLTGSVRLGATEGFGGVFLAPHLADFCAKHPAISVDLIAVPRFVNLSKREADLAVNVERPQTGSYVISKLSDYRLMLYATRKYLTDHPQISKLSDVAQHKMIGYVDELAFSTELRYLDTLAPTATVSMRSTSIVAQLNAARRGSALAILPCFMAGTCPDLVPVLPESASIVRTFWLVTPKENRNIARVRTLWDYLRAAVEVNQSFLMGETAEFRSLKS